MQFLESRIVPFSLSDDAFRVAPSGLTFRLGCCAAPGFPEFACTATPATATRIAPRRQSIWLYRRYRTLSCPNALRSPALQAACLLRVAPPPACRSAPPVWSCGLPRLPHRSGFAGDGAIGFPIVRIHSAVPIDRPPGFPSLSPSVSPMIRRQVAPRFGSSGSGWCVSRVASGRAFRVCQWFDHRVSPDRFPLVSPAVELAGCPVSSGPLAAPSAQFQVALILGLRRLPRGLVSGFPQTACPLACRRCLCELPRSNCDGWNVDESPAVCELCILGLHRG